MGGLLFDTYTDVERFYVKRSMEQLRKSCVFKRALLRASKSPALKTPTKTNAPRNARRAVKV